MTPETTITDNLDLLLPILPTRIERKLHDHPRLHDLIEVVIDLGRPIEARFSDGFELLEASPATQDDLDYVVSRISDLDRDNRAGIERTLHRISAMRNRLGNVVGLTCRVGRAVFGTIDIIRDVVETGANILLLGRPGVGKTTKLREIARVLSDDFQKRVIVVDTNNEIAGDGDIPHPAIGRARRMQVPNYQQQHAVMIEAVENHMPEVVVIDEIGTQDDADAARTIAERGVQLIGTAHGNSLENLMSNPTLADLVGGIQAVTLGDEEARKRRTQKTVLERKAPPTFDTIVEIKAIDHLVIHHDVAATVDAILLDFEVAPEVRKAKSSGEYEILQESRVETVMAPEGELERLQSEIADRHSPRSVGRLYIRGVSPRKVEKALRELRIPAALTRQVDKADVVLALQAAAGGLEEEAAGLQVEMIRSNTYSQISEALRRIFKSSDSAREEFAVREVELAVQRVMSDNQSVELMPQNSYIRRLQHEYAAKHNFRSTSVGKEPHRRVMILPG